jgi:hypothetical protein
MLSVVTHEGALIEAEAAAWAAADFAKAKTSSSVDSDGCTVQPNVQGKAPPLSLHPLSSVK